MFIIKPEIKALMESENLGDCILGFKCLMEEHPRLFIFENEEEWGEQYFPTMLKKVLDINQINRHYRMVEYFHDVYGENMDDLQNAKKWIKGLMNQ